MYAQLGSTQFDTLFSYDTFKKETATKYVEIPLIGGKPDLHRTGLTLDIIALSIRLHISFCNPAFRYAELEAYRINGEILPFIDGSGNMIGNFVIEKITQTVDQTDPKGAVICCTCEIELKEYVDPDRLAARKAAAQRNAFALDAKSATFNSPAANLTPKADIFKSLQDINTGTTATGFNINSALSSPSEQQSFLDQAEKSVNLVIQGISDAQEKLSTYVSMVTAPIGFAASLATIGSAAGLLLTAIRTGDISNISADMSLLTGSVNGMNLSSLTMERLIILRQ